MINQIISGLAELIDSIRSPIQIVAIIVAAFFTLMGYLVYLNSESLIATRLIVADSTRASLAERISDSDKSDLTLIQQSSGAKSIALITYQGIRAKLFWTTPVEWAKSQGFAVGDEWLIIDDLGLKKALEDPTICLASEEYSQLSPRFAGFDEIVTVPVTDPITDKLEGRLILIFNQPLAPEQINIYCSYLKAGAKSLRD